MRRRPEEIASRDYAENLTQDNRRTDLNIRTISDRKLSPQHQVDLPPLSRRNA